MISKTDKTDFHLASRVLPPKPTWISSETERKALEFGGYEFEPSPGCCRMPIKPVQRRFSCLQEAVPSVEMMFVARPVHQLSQHSTISVLTQPQSQIPKSILHALSSSSITTPVKSSELDSSSDIFAVNKAVYSLSISPNELLER